MKKLFPFVISVALLLTGCGMKSTVTVSSDGSVSVETRIGYTTEERNNGASGIPAETMFYIGGTRYTGTSKEEEFRGVDDFNEDYGEYAMLSKGERSFTLFLFEPDVPSELTKAKVVANFPYPVQQVKGSGEGVKIKDCAIEVDPTRVVGDSVFYVGDVNAYTDVNSNAWYFTAVEYVKAIGAMSGTSHETFSPDKELSYAELCQVLYNVSGQSGPDQKYWAYNAITYCLDKGYISAMGEVNENNYSGVANREEAFAAIVRCLIDLTHPSEEQLEFKGVIPDISTISQPYREDIKRAYALGISSGVNVSGEFMPEAPITRAQLAQTFYNIRITTNPVE